MRKILIIDDDQAHLDSARGILEAEGYEVFTQNQPFGATNAVIRLQPDLVLLDVNMPALSGDRLAEVLRANSLTRNVKVALHSSNDEDHHGPPPRPGRLHLQGQSGHAAQESGGARGWLRRTPPTLHSHRSSG